jgi:tetratricopeptide (TPR) repeat protein
VWPRRHAAAGRPCVCAEDPRPVAGPRRARRYTGNRRLDRAEKLERRADARITANPRDAQAQFKRATVLAHLNRDDEAINAFIALTQTYPELPEPYNNLAALYAKHGRYTEAREALETATKANPNYGLAYENLGDLYLRLADSAYQRAHDLGQATGPTQQRLTDIQKIISPPKGSEKPVKKVAAPDDYTNRATSNITESPAFQFGGDMAPSQ